MRKGENWRPSIEPESLEEGRSEIHVPCYGMRGFLTGQDTLDSFPADSPYQRLDQIGRDLPSLLHDCGFRRYAKGAEPDDSGKRSV